MTIRSRQVVLGLFTIAGFLTTINACTTQREESKPRESAVPDPAQQELIVGEKFIEAFYSWQPQTLAPLIQNPDDQDRALYYQAWAEAGNYKIKTRRPCVTNGDGVSCAITVTDDIGGALGHIATDTFLLQVEADKVVSVEFTSDDPPIFNALFEWMGEYRPEIFSGPCKNLFDGGDTPAECVRAVVRAAKEFQKLPRKLNEQ